MIKRHALVAVLQKWRNIVTGWKLRFFQEKKNYIGFDVLIEVAINRTSHIF
jgi:hypothetical protein